MKENNENKPRKVGYFKYKRLERQELYHKGVSAIKIDDLIAFQKKYKPCALIYFLRYLPGRLSNLINAYKIARLRLGKQKWKNGKLYIEKIPYFIASKATNYLMAIIRDYLRAYAKDAYAIGNVLFEKDGKEICGAPLVRAVTVAGDGALEDWRKMVNDVADKFDRAADLWIAVWDSDDWKDTDRLWQEYRAALIDAFDDLKVIFQDLND